MIKLRVCGSSRTGAALLALATLTACGGSSGDGTIAPPPPPPPPTPPAAPPGVALDRVFPQLSFSQPVALLQAPADTSRWFVVEKAGVVRLFDNQPGTSASAVFIDISSQVDSAPSEAGLLGMAFHPNFAANGEVFLSYTRSGAPLVSVVARFSSRNAGNTLDPSSEEIILTVPQDFSNHNGGHIAFRGDGNLYIGFGDGGSANDPNNRAQDDSTLLGKLLRIDIDGGAPYAIPAGNPFAANAPCVQGSGTAPCPEIFASGLRNPWRWSFDRQNDEIWVGDVGQGAFEEIDLVESGNNLGWRIREGANCNIPASGCQTANLTDPVFEYGRSLGSSVTGGYVYRGGAISGLDGFYIFGDFGSGRLWALPAATRGAATELLDTAFSISAFGEDNGGELYLLDYGAGAIYRLVPGP